jgi:hypothetical protein
MRAQLRGLHSLDAPAGLETHTPTAERRFRVLIEAEIGPADSTGADVFSFLVVGPDWFADNPAEKGFRWGRHYLIVDRWDYEVARRAIDDLCAHTEGRDWGEVARKIASFGDWEFDSERPTRSAE